jgi:hypothetical protein
MKGLEKRSVYARGWGEGYWWVAVGVLLCGHRRGWPRYHGVKGRKKESVCSKPEKEREGMRKSTYSVTAQIDSASMLAMQRPTGSSISSVMLQLLQWTFANCYESFLCLKLAKWFQFHETQSFLTSWQLRYSRKFPSFMLPKIITVFRTKACHCNMSLARRIFFVPS